MHAWSNVLYKLGEIMQQSIKINPIQKVPTRYVYWNEYCVKY